MSFVFNFLTPLVKVQRVKLENKKLFVAVHVSFFFKVLIPTKLNENPLTNKTVLCKCHSYPAWWFCRGRSSFESFSPSESKSPSSSWRQEILKVTLCEGGAGSVLLNFPLISQVWWYARTGMCRCPLLLIPPGIMTPLHTGLLQSIS